ncbi:MAG TPA: STAS domain-containing protein [Actinophytocola sp.]|jgi:anti-anti-sigma factor|uniref:STAS domain-containing protein n=1 Tax=Actinophytocola sp. TaxID=1872138 RepID=UPI002F93EF02
MPPDPGSDSGNAFDVTVDVERHDTAVVLRVAGELDMLTTPKLQECITRELAAGPAVLVIDLSDVTFLASSAMAAIVSAHQEAGERSAVRIVATSRETARPLEVAGLNTYLAIFPTLEDALA